MKKLLSLILVTGLLMNGCLGAAKPDEKSVDDDATTLFFGDENVMNKMNSTDQSVDIMMLNVVDELRDAMMVMVGDRFADVKDVSGGNVIGSAATEYNEDKGFHLKVTFENLKTPKDNFFYEGWLVRRGEFFSVVSTGKLEVTDGVYTNLYASFNDYSDYDFYVLTLEPNDNDPAPAAHIAEGGFNPME